MKHIKSKKILLATFCVTSLIVGSFFIYQLSGKIRNLSVLSEGVTTCISRVTQSYTASLLGNFNSPFVQASFMQDTESCLADTTAYLETHLAKSFSGEIENFNNLNSLSNEFHRKIETISNNPDFIASGSLGRRFEKIENLKDSIIKKIDELNGKALSSFSSLKWSFFILVGFVSIFILIETWNYSKKLSDNKLVEDEAYQNFIETGFAPETEVKELLTKTLEKNGLKNCAELVNRAITPNIINERKEFEVEDLNNFQKPKAISTLGKSKVEIESQIEKMWDEEAGQKIDIQKLSSTASKLKTPGPLLDLEDKFATVISHLSSKIVTYGISIETDIPPGLNLVGEVEKLDQIIFNIINNAVESCKNLTDETREKKIIIRAKRLGNTAMITLLDTGKGHSEDFLKLVSGMKPSEEKEWLDFEITREFIKELGASLIIENLYDTKNSVIGSKTQLALKVQPKDVKKVTITKGKKKDLIKQMNV